MNPTCVFGLRAIAGLAVVLAAVVMHSPASAQTDASACGPLAAAGGYGPYDYRTDRDKLSIVEGPHFPPSVEALIKGKSGTIGAELSYTLRAFPNHHRALNAVMRYGEKLKTPQPRDLEYPVECYFERALRFRPDDTVARMLYAQFLGRNKRATEALGQLAITAEKAGDNAFTHYNIGMLYVDLKEYDKALARAHEAYRLGFLRPELRERLAIAGKWTDPMAEPKSAEPAPASSAPAAPSAPETGGAPEPGKTPG